MLHRCNKNPKRRNVGRLREDTFWGPTRIGRAIRTWRTKNLTQGPRVGEVRAMDFEHVEPLTYLEGGYGALHAGGCEP